MLGALGLGIRATVCVLMGSGGFVGPPVATPGYTILPRARLGQVNLELSGQWYFDQWSGGSLHVEPNSTHRLSFPLSISGGPEVGIRGRVGARYRLRDILSLGGGFGMGGFYLSQSPTEYRYADESRHEAVVPRHVSGFLDFELVVGSHRKWFHGGAALRPAVGIFKHLDMEQPRAFVYLGVDLFCGFHVTKRIAITWRIEFGVGSDPVRLQEVDKQLFFPGYDFILVIGSSLGLLFQL